MLVQHFHLEQRGKERERHTKKPGGKPTEEKHIKVLAGTPNPQ